MMVRWSMKRRHKLRYIGVERHIGVGKLMRQAIRECRQSIVPANPVQGVGLLGEYEWAHGGEQRLPDARAETLRNGQLGNDEPLMSERTPVGIGDREVGNGRDSGAHGKREPKIAHDGVGVQASEQAQIVLDVPV